MTNRHSNPEQSTTSTPSHAQQKTAPTTGQDTHMNLSLNLVGSLYICMPLFSEDTDDENMSVYCFVVWRTFCFVGIFVEARSLNLIENWAHSQVYTGCQEKTCTFLKINIRSVFFCFTLVSVFKFSRRFWCNRIVQRLGFFLAVKPLS